METLEKTFTQISENACPGSTIILECSVPIGTTRRLGASLRGQFKIAYSPSRIDIERSAPMFKDVPKLIGALDENSMVVAKSLYDSVFSKVVKTESTEIAEGANLLESTFRSVNIAFINEFDDICKKAGVDTHQVITAASTKPFAFLEFMPGVGAGGLSVPVDPYLLMKTVGGPIYSPLLGRALQSIEERPRNIAKEIKGSKNVLIVGVGYKRNSSIWKDSPITTLIESSERETKFSYYDPFIRDYPFAREVDLPVDACEFDKVIVNHPYMLTFFDSAQWVQKTLYFCEH